MTALKILKRENLSDVVIFMGMATNALFIVLILYFFVF